MRVIKKSKHKNGEFDQVTKKELLVYENKDFSLLFVLVWNTLGIQSVFVVIIIMFCSGAWSQFLHVCPVLGFYFDHPTSSSFFLQVA